jgi:hypothetical protein
MTILGRIARVPLLRSFTGAALIAVTLAAPRNARAQADEQRAAARSLAVEGAKACSDSRWQDCVNLFQRAESVVHAPPHLLYMARAEEKLGHIVRARELYLKITREHLADNAPQAFKESQSAATVGAQKLEPRIAYLTIQLAGDGGKAVEVSMDGDAVPAALVGVPRPVDPGEHRLEGKGPQLAAAPQTTTLVDGQRGTVTLTFEAVPEAPVAAAVGLQAAPTSAATPQDSGGSSGSSTMRIASYAALGVGVVGLGIGTGFAVSSSSKRSDADELYAKNCPCGKTDPVAAQIASLDDSARTAGTISIVGFVVGGVGVATGAVLFFLSGKKNTEQSSTVTGKITPWVGLGSAGVSGTY